MGKKSHPNIPIFRAGRHTSASGDTLDFSDDALKAAVSAYDPAKHEAPITVGHPKDNLPAYGWIKSMQFNDKDRTVSVAADDVEAEFAEMVNAGRFKKRSASFYTPDAPNNPVPGVYYLRHVAFLGAAAPAVKGLKDVSFSDESGVLEFDDLEFADGMMASAFRRLREWIISKYNTEEADKVLPGYLVESMEEEARRARESESVAPASSPAFSEDDAMSKEQLDAANAENAALKQQVATLQQFADQKAELDKREQQLVAKETDQQLDVLIAAGKVTPAMKPHLAAFAAGLNSTVTVEFGEGDKAVKEDQRASFFRLLGGLPKAVDFKEHSAEGGDGKTIDTTDDAKVAAEARQYHEQQAEKGNHISFTEAVAAVREGKHKQA